MKNATFTVEFTAQINDDVDPCEVSFNMDVSKIIPQVVNESSEPVGTVTGYTTVNAFTDEE